MCEDEGVGKDMRVLCVIGIPIVTLFISYWLLSRREQLDSGFCKKNPDQKQKLVLIYIIVSVCLLVLLGIRLIWYCPDQGVLFQCKRMVCLSLLFAAALVDWKEQIIPNRLLVAGLLFRFSLVIAEAIFEREDMTATILSELIGAVGIFLVCMVFLLLMKNSIGMGDIKLFMVMGLYLGIYSMIDAIMSSLILAFFWAVILLLTHKKGKKDVLPFAPAVLAGTYLSIFLTGI